MSMTLLLVVLGGLVVGYALVDWFMGKAQSAPPMTEPASEPVSTAVASEAPHWSLVLVVAPDASTEKIRDAYRRLIGAYHPDKVASLGPEIRAVAERKTKEIVIAFKEAMADREAA